MWGRDHLQRSRPLPWSKSERDLCLEFQNKSIFDSSRRKPLSMWWKGSVETPPKRFYPETFRGLLGTLSDGGYRKLDFNTQQSDCVTLKWVDYIYDYLPISLFFISSPFSSVSRPLKCLTWPVSCHLSSDIMKRKGIPADDVSWWWSTFSTKPEEFKI